MRNKVAFVVALAAMLIPVRLAAQNGDEELLRTRELVWRAWFDGDTKTVEQLVPPETIVMSASEPAWKKQAEIVQESAEFHQQGGKLMRLSFPRTEVQHFGDVAIIWSSYELETEVAGKHSASAGRVTEVFVKRDGRWTNPGWHTDHVTGQ